MLNSKIYLAKVNCNAQKAKVTPLSRIPTSFWILYAVPLCRWWVSGLGSARLVFLWFVSKFGLVILRWKCQRQNLWHLSKGRICPDIGPRRYFSKESLSLIFSVGDYHIHWLYNKNKTEGSIARALKWSIFIIQKQALHKNGVEFRQQFNGAIFTSLATLYDDVRRRAT